METLRIAVISTPRSGNTWIRHVLSDALDLQQIAVHNPRDIPSVLPPRLALQIHWYREPNFQSFLKDNGFKAITIARHPLDVLVSAWRFARREPQTARWLEGNAEIPLELGAPASHPFLRYALSFGAENLLSVSYQWWQDSDAVPVHYETLFNEPREGFSALIEKLGKSTATVQSAIEANPIKKLQDTPNRHAWQGTPGLWRRFITPFDARRIYLRHRRVFDVLGYGVMPPYLLTRRTAMRNWATVVSD